MRSYAAKGLAACCIALFAALVFVVGFGFLVAAFFLFLTAWLAPPQAALLTGVVAIVIAGLLVVGARLTWSAQMGKRRKRGIDPTAEGAALAAELVNRAGERSVELTIAAFTAGLIFGYSPRARRWVNKQLQ